MKPKYPINGVVLGDMTTNMDFEQTALSMPENITKCLPDPDHLRACIMRGHDGSYHSQDSKTARRHNAFHDLMNVNQDESHCDMYGNHGDFKLVNGKHNGMVFDRNRFDYLMSTHYVDKNLGGLVQKAVVMAPDGDRAWSYKKPTAPKEGSPEIHTSWLQTIARKWTPDGVILLPNNEIDYQDGVLVHGPDNGTFSKNKLFEMVVDFSNMSTGGHRHSWWAMPINSNAAYDADKRNGTEIDFYEHEVNDNKEFSEKCFMKTLGGDVIGNTVNEIPYTLDDNKHRKKSHIEGAVHLPDVNVGLQTFSILIEQKGTDSRIRWFRNGVEVVRDSKLAPLDVMMYTILSREVNVDSGLSGQNVYDYIDQIENDYVLTKYIRGWDVKNPYGYDDSLSNTNEAFVAPDTSKLIADAVRDLESVVERLKKHL